MVGKEVDRAAQSAAPKAMRHLPAQEVVTVRDRRDVVHQSSIGLGKTEIGNDQGTISTRRSCGYVQLKSDFAERPDGEFHELSDHDVAEKVRKIRAHRALPWRASDTADLGQRVKPPSMMWIVPVVKVASS